jgi:hypothetical protein
VREKEIQMNNAGSQSLLSLPERIARRLPHLRQSDITVISIAVGEVFAKMDNHAYAHQSAGDRRVAEL